MFDGHLYSYGYSNYRVGFDTGTQITTARKAVTLLLSYLIFTKPLTEQHGSGLLLISMGIILKMLPENKAPTRVPISNATVKYGKSYLKDERRAVENIDDEEHEEKSPLV